MVHQVARSSGVATPVGGRGFRRDPAAQLMMKELFVAHRRRLELLLQKRTKFARLIFFREGRGPIVERGFELGALGLAQFVIDPGGPLFLKRFHKHLATNSAVSCARRTGAT